MRHTIKITEETRAEGYQAALPFVESIQEACLKAVQSDAHGLTAEDVRAIVGCSLNSARSRLTELTKAGRVVVVGKAQNQAQTRMIAVYAAGTEGA